MVPCMGCPIVLLALFLPSLLSFAHCATCGQEDGTQSERDVYSWLFDGEYHTSGQYQTISAYLAEQEYNEDCENIEGPAVTPCVNPLDCVIIPVHQDNEPEDGKRGKKIKIERRVSEKDAPILGHTEPLDNETYGFEDGDPVSQAKWASAMSKVNDGRDQNWWECQHLPYAYGQLEVDSERDDRCQFEKTDEGNSYVPQTEEQFIRHPVENQSVLYHGGCQSKLSVESQPMTNNGNQPAVHDLLRRVSQDQLNLDAIDQSMTYFQSVRARCPRVVRQPRSNENRLVRIIYETAAFLNASPFWLQIGRPNTLLKVLLAVRLLVRVLANKNIEFSQKTFGGPPGDDFYANLKSGLRKGHILAPIFGFRMMFLRTSFFRCSNLTFCCTFFPTFQMILNNNSKHFDEQTLDLIWHKLYWPDGAPLHVGVDLSSDVGCTDDRENGAK